MVGVVGGGGAVGSDGCGGAVEHGSSGVEGGLVGDSWVLHSRQRRGKGDKAHTLWPAQGRNSGAHHLGRDDEAGRGRHQREDELAAEDGELPVRRVWCEALREVRELKFELREVGVYEEEVLLGAFGAPLDQPAHEVAVLEEEESLRHGLGEGERRRQGVGAEGISRAEGEGVGAGDRGSGRD